MALVLNDRVQQTGTANTTVSFTLSGSVTGFQSFSVIGNGNTTYYSATDTSGNWEVGLGTYSTTGPTLTRTTILSSSNSNTAVTFVGTVNVFVTYPSGKSVNQDASGNLTGYVIENSTVGATTPSTGAFTTLSASSTVSGTGFSTYLASPPAIGGTTPAAGTFTTLSLTGTTNQISSVAVSSDPAAPSAGNLKTFAKTIGGGYTAPAFLNATNAAVQLQPSIANKHVGFVLIGNTTTPNVVGMNAYSGTTAAVSVASTNMYTRAFKFQVSSTATAGTFANYYQGTPGFSLGTATTIPLGGFYYVTRFGIADTVAAPRTFIGLGSSGSAPTNVEPSTLTNVIGVGQGAADTNLKIYYGGSAAQTPIDLGVNFPTGTSTTDWYEFTLYAPPTSTNTVYYQVIRLNTGDKASGTLTGTAGTVLPANTTFLGVRNWRTNNATATAVILQIGGIYVETDY